ncbi:MAG: beta-ketoacyl-[acyl-carrier-protein] synthase family protein [Betaproteobacteria bacterium]|nr:beta-ketoacyl-[acyl-carrier-protein] synthase family protein [Betaproteobacteria bacterium]
MLPRRVVVTGLGQVAPHGRDVAAGFEALLAGRSAITRNTVGEPPHSCSLASAQCEGFDAAAELGRARVVTMDRFSQLSVLAGRSAWSDAGLDASDALSESVRELACVMWGTGGGGLQTLERGYRDLFVKGRPRISPLSVVMGMNNAAAAQLALLFGLGGACLTYSVACASSAVALGEAMRRVRWGECDLALAGGAEAALPYGTVKAWQSMQVLASADETGTACRPFDAGRIGLVLGEGAAALVLESRDHALARGARIYAELAGAGSSCDHRHLSTPDAAGQLRALQAAVRDAGIDAAEVAYVNAHGTATIEGDAVEAEALRRLFGARAPRVAVSATKSMHGHLMGAAGALEALVSVMAVYTGHIPPTAHLHQIDPACAGLDHVMGSGRHDVGVTVALSNSFAFGGSNSVLVFRRDAVA